MMQVGAKETQGVLESRGEFRESHEGTQTGRVGWVGEGGARGDARKLSDVGSHNRDSLGQQDNRSRKSR